MLNFDQSRSSNSLVVVQPVGLNASKPSMNSATSEFGKLQKQDHYILLFLNKLFTYLELLVLMWRKFTRTDSIIFCKELKNGTA